ncbi:MAG: lysophospholipid acyltransferase family protein [Planctomycetota bacterium]|nr:lysophospholipid acyltransferase family protein [Planctomycetota bacterium]
MKIRSPFLNSLGGLLGSAAICRWMSTLEYKAALYDPTVDPVHEEYQGQKIYIFWHEYILFPLYLRGHNNLSMLLSQHSDAEILSRVAYHLGFDCVRGSTYRGGLKALRELIRKSEGMNLTITPDGPRGPRRELSQGPIYLASKLGLPIVAMGFGYDQPWRIRTWDRFALPRPFSRARAVVSPQIHLPADLDRDGLEHYRVHVETLLNRLTLEAEAWAESGTRKREEVPMTRQHGAQRPPQIETADSKSDPSEILPWRTAAAAETSPHRAAS